MKAKWIYTARDSGKRFAEQEKNLTDQRGDVLLTVDIQKKYQQILGFGGAFTDTAAAALAHMGQEQQQAAMQAYFDRENGLAYNMGRIPIGGCDFSSVPYSHAEIPGDISLTHYSVEQDKKGIIPLIRYAKMLMSESVSGEELLLYALPWSPPGWMKTNGEMNWGGRLLPQYYPVMASYLVRFVQAYEKEGIPIWGLAAQNEPVEIQRWPSCEYTGEEERIFLKEYLIPALDQAGYGEKKILFWDCNKDLLAERAEELLGDEVLCKRVFGAAFHWYSGDYFEELDKVHQKFPATELLSTECCVVMPEHLEEWSIGERYAHEIIGDLNHWTCAWMDWNLFLNQNSGPGIADNPCAAPIILDEERQTLIKMSSYYYIGHFSRYIKRGAFRVHAELTGKGEICNELQPEICAFLNPDGETVIVILNSNDHSLHSTVAVGERQIDIKMEPHSIGTLILNSMQS